MRAARREFQIRKLNEFWRITLVSIDIRLRTSIDRLSITSSDDTLRVDDTSRVDFIVQCREDHDARGVRSKTPTSAQPITY